MKQQFVIAGTDTNIGKTILSSLLMCGFDDLSYWKPVQSGLEDETDTEVVRRLSGCSDERIIGEAYRLNQPLSPHLSARLDRVTIDTSRLVVPQRSPLVIELAGGLLVPITDDVLQIDIVKRWNLPVILATRSSLGTINHSLLSIEAMRSRGIEIAGFVPIGEHNPENERAVERMGRIQLIGRISRIGHIDRASLLHEFQTHFTPLRTLLQ